MFPGKLVKHCTVGGTRTFSGPNLTLAPCSDSPVSTCCLFSGQFCEGGDNEGSESRAHLLGQMAGWSLEVRVMCLFSGVDVTVVRIQVQRRHTSSAAKCCFSFRIESIDKMESDFKNCHMFLVTILNKAVCRGSFPHCESVVWVMMSYAVIVYGDPKVQNIQLGKA